jgi:hypothetical protein
MDIATVAARVMPYLAAAIGAYGTAVWAKAQDVAAEETVGPVGGDSVRTGAARDVDVRRG